MSGLHGRFVDLRDLYKRDILTPEELAAVDRPSALYEKASRVFDEERKKAVEWVGQQCLEEQLMLLECSTKLFSICHDQRGALHDCQNRAMDVVRTKEKEWRQTALAKGEQDVKAVLTEKFGPEAAKFKSRPMN
eukprot:TRINITY_DN18858_c0_g1_i1.p1 TRINITY_DN18858_c0_g1~~TRINITY_DN18858_c0_g1_i1.p1  ORF type:complete len:134 (+),score=8.72 TRINITY_DN18858_c0_g1_i1:93-494(+)